MSVLKFSPYIYKCGR